jgi:hypothetical protein
MPPARIFRSPAQSSVAPSASPLAGAEAISDGDAERVTEDGDPIRHDRVPDAMELIVGRGHWMNDGSHRHRPLGQRCGRGRRRLRRAVSSLRESDLQLPANGGLDARLTSRTFLEAWRRRAEVQLFGDTLLPWLYGVAANVVRAESRSRRRRRDAYARIPLPLDALDVADEVTERLDDERTMQRIVDALNELSEIDRDVLVLAWQRFELRRDRPRPRPTGRARSGHACHAREHDYGSLSPTATKTTTTPAMLRLRLEMTMDAIELPRDRQLSDEQLSRLENALRAQIASPTTRPTAAVRSRIPRRLTQRPVVLITALVCAAAAAAVALAVAFHDQSGTDIACLSDPTLSARVYDMVPNQQDPIAACAREW